MNDPLIARFASACGATGPLDLRVALAEGGPLAEGSVQQPFTLVGRDEACDVTLNDPGVHLRHVWLQVVDGRVFATDLGSRAGLVWPSGEAGPGWLDVGVPVRVGPFRVSLRAPVSAAPARPPRGVSPLQADSTADRTHPAVHLDFRNGKRARDRWPVNRAITLVGRSDGCKIHLNADDVAAYHCGLVHTRAGLWVVDLSGRGVVVSGERMRVAPLPHGAELWVGRFLISCRYPAAGHTPAGIRAPDPSSARLAAPPPPDPTVLESPPAAGTWVAPALPTAAEDEVPLGTLPQPDPVCGLPSSHIMCDAFRPGGTSGNLSAPILVSGAAPGAGPRPPAGDDPTAPAAELFETIFRQFGDLHGQMFDQIQHSLLMMLQLWGGGHDARADAVRRELAGVKELSVELGKVQAEIARLALTQALGAAPGPARPGPADPTPVPDRTPNTAEAIEDWVQERIGSLQRERQSRWQKLAGLVAAGDDPRG